MRPKQVRQKKAAKHFVNAGATTLMVTSAMLPASLLTQSAQVKADDRPGSKKDGQSNWVQNTADQVRDQIAQQGKPADAADYQVQWGDTLDTIAANYDTTAADLAQRFHLPNEGMILAGYKLSDQAQAQGNLADAGYQVSSQSVVPATTSDDQGSKLLVVDPNQGLAAPTEATPQAQDVMAANANAGSASASTAGSAAASTAADNQAASSLSVSTSAAASQQGSQQAAAAAAPAYRLPAESAADSQAQAPVTPVVNSQSSQSTAAKPVVTNVASSQSTAQTVGDTADHTGVSQDLNQIYGSMNASESAQTTATSQAQSTTANQAASASQSASQASYQQQSAANSQAAQQSAAASQQASQAAANSQSISASQAAAAAVPASTSTTVSAHKVDNDKLVNWFYNNEGKLTYSMSGSRNGTDGTADCSGAMTEALYEAGASQPAYLYNTDSLHSYLTQNGYKLIAENQSWDAQKGDIVIWGQKGASNGAAGHVQVISSNDPNAKAISVSYYTGGATGTAVSELPYDQYYNKVAKADGEAPYTYVYRQV
ncbi:LysM peptidoglycan-binding domain-containing protein [Leuconostocaceae bacterium ESL0723]|nr:LysM peptidoglycan-binding domain-containing protein [Leuconostocaceae bacterium ESL0723]